MTDADLLLFDRRRHREALVLRGADALRRGQFANAFAHADRLCRINPPNASDYLFRSATARAAGFADLAAADIARAAEADPTDQTVLRLLLRHGDAEERRGAARALVDDPASDDALLRLAIAELFAGGEQAVLRLRLVAGRLKGWAVWRGGKAMELAQVRGGVPDAKPLAADPAHVFTEAGRCACAFDLDPEALLSVAILEDERRLDGWTPLPICPPPPREKQSAKLWVIVPVYEDFAATRACLLATMAQLGDAEARLVVIDDASPNGALRGWLDVQAASGQFELIRNPVNLGFAVSVNRALEICGGGDVVLLNADALPPPGALRRLAALAQGSPGVGALSPLSNNGETCSFPAPNASSPLPPPDEIARLDALARRANGNRLIDLPNGIGFCLYITRACLDAVGPLPRIYGRGYYEDVEFCLRAREKGFRTVCAAGVYVGHAGSLSFGADKRRLVMGNLRLLTSRFPGHEAECAAFLRADPVREARAAIERLDPPQRPFRLLVAAAGAAELEARAQARGFDAAAEGPAPLLCLYDPALQRVRLRGPGAEAPQSLEFPLRAPGDADGLRVWLSALNLSGVAIYFSTTLPATLVEVCASLAADWELVIAHLDFVDVDVAGLRDAPCEQPEGGRPCPSCAVALSVSAGSAARLRVWQAAVGLSASVRPIDRMTAHIARKLFPDAQIVPEDSRVPEQPGFAHDLSGAPGAGALRAGALDAMAADFFKAAPGRAQVASARTLGILAPLPEAGADALIVALARALRRRGDPTRLVVFGHCLDDQAAMAPGNVFVAGAVEADQIASLLGPYAITDLMSCSRTRFFGRLDALAARSGLARAGFDWSSGAVRFAAGDLALDPRLCHRKAAELTADWLARRSDPHPSVAGAQKVRAK